MSEKRMGIPMEKSVNEDWRSKQRRGEKSTWPAKCDARARGVIGLPGTPPDSPQSGPLPRRPAPQSERESHPQQRPYVLPLTFFEKPILRHRGCTLDHERDLNISP